MDKDTFTRDIYNALVPNISAHTYKGLMQLRRDRIRQLNPKIDSIDGSLIDAAVHSKFNFDFMEKISPGFSARLRRYQEVRMELIADLTKLNQNSNQEVKFFQEWLHTL
jgi:hypothetical protein